MGDFRWQQAPATAIDGVTDVIAWKAAVHDIDPAGYTWTMGDGSKMPRVVGHLDVGRTSCPGKIYDLLGQIRKRAAAAQYPFDDVSSRSTHRHEIHALWLAGMLHGCAARAYCPRDDVTRGQAATLMANALEIPASSRVRFTDVSRSHTHAGAINALADRGIINGYGDETFRPNALISREEIATVMARALRLPRKGGDAFRDVATGATHRGSVYALLDARLTQGCAPGRFCPQGSTTRDQAASLAYRTREYMVVHDVKIR